MNYIKVFLFISFTFGQTYSVGDYVDNLTGNELNLNFAQVKLNNSL